jgi:glycosyltransferase involved in cell wall biosynthesis
MSKVSAIIPVFNGEATLREAIDSALAQDLDDLEVIVIDDGSTDSTPAIIASYGARLRHLQQPNSGPATARNAAVKNAAGEYLAFLDADDKWLPGMLRRTVALLESDPGCVLVYGDSIMVDSDGVSLESSLVQGDHHPPSMGEILTRMWPIMPSAALIRRSAFDHCGGFAEEFTHAGYEDAFLWLRLREQGHFRYLDEALAVWRFSLFPTPIKPRAPKDDRKTFARLVRQQYGTDPFPLLEARRRAPRSILGYIGLRALRRGDRATAREAFTRALQLDPWRLKNTLRLMRTFLPLSLASSLSGRTRNDGTRCSLD